MNKVTDNLKIPFSGVPFILLKNEDISVIRGKICIKNLKKTIKWKRKSYKFQAFISLDLGNFLSQRKARLSFSIYS